jgi:hypothetical protein
MSYLKTFWNFIKGFKDWLDLILKIVAVIGLLSGIFGIRGCIKKDDVVKAKELILKRDQKELKLKDNTIAFITDKFKVENRTLRQKISQEQAKSSVYLNDLRNAQGYALELEVKLKNVENYQSSNIEANDSVKTEIVFINCDQVEIKPIKKKHIEITFDQSGKYLDVNYKYNAEITTLVFREKNPEQFFLGRWFNPDWLYKSSTKINDPNAKVTNSVNIEFDR